MKSEPDRKHVRKNCDQRAQRDPECARVQRGCVDAGRQRPSRAGRYPFRERDRGIAFRHVEQQREDAGELAERSRDVRGANVVAADFPNVGARRQLHDQKAERNGSDQVSRDEEAGDAHQRILAATREALDGPQRRRVDRADEDQ